MLRMARGRSGADPRGGGALVDREDGEIVMSLLGEPDDGVISAELAAQPPPQRDTFTLEDLVLVVADESRDARIVRVQQGAVSGGPPLQLRERLKRKRTGRVHVN